MRELENPQERLLTPGEVALLFRVDPKTVTRWANIGKLRSIRTLGGIGASLKRKCAPNCAA